MLEKYLNSRNPKIHYPINVLQHMDFKDLDQAKHTHTHRREFAVTYSIKERNAKVK